MSTIVTIAGSPSTASSSDALLSHVTRRIIRAGHAVVPIVLRDLPAAALLAGDVTDPEVAAAIAAVRDADALVVVSPVYQAAYSGLLKVFLDVLPQFALRGKSVLPLVTGKELTAGAGLVDWVRPTWAEARARHAVAAGAAR